MKNFHASFLHGYNMYKIIEKNNIKVLKFNIIESFGLTKHYYSLRKGGVSSPPFESLNLGLHTSDKPENVITNRKLLEKNFSIPVRDVIKLEHGDKILPIYDNKIPNEIPLADAIMTNVKNVPLSIFYADCTGIFILDPVKKVIALVHAGWRGTLKAIALKTVEAMKKEYGTDSKNCVSAICPSIGPCCFEVSEETANLFLNSFNYYPEIFLKDFSLCISKNNKRYFVNLWNLNKIQLLCAGLKSENIVSSNICTSCQNDLFFSYRRENRVTGRMGAVFMLR